MRQSIDVLQYVGYGQLRIMICYYTIADICNEYASLGTTMLMLAKNINLHFINGFLQDWAISAEILQSCTKPPKLY